jgi:hypothetical protein
MDARKPLTRNAAGRWSHFDAANKTTRPTVASHRRDGDVSDPLTSGTFRRTCEP